MSVNNLFLKTDNSGKRVPTILTCILVGALVFGSYFFSKKNKPVRKLKTEAKESIIQAKDIIAAANNPFTNQKKAVDLIPNILDFPKPKIDMPVFMLPPKPPEVSRPPINTKMIVFDATKDYQSNLVIPLGSMVKCLLIHNIVTNNFDAPVIAQVWEDFYFDGKLLLPFGTRIYGTATAGRQRDRVLVKFDNIVFQDGKTIKINAIALSQDGSGGLTGKVINDGTKKTILAMAMNLLSGVALGFQQTNTNAITGIDQVESNSRNALLNGVANSFQKQAQQTQNDIENSKGYAIVLAGNQLGVYFENKADIGV